LAQCGCERLSESGRLGIFAPSLMRAATPSSPTRCCYWSSGVGATDRRRPRRSDACRCVFIKAERGPSGAVPPACRGRPARPRRTRLIALIHASAVVVTAQASRLKLAQVRSGPGELSHAYQARSAANSGIHHSFLSAHRAAYWGSSTGLSPGTWCLRPARGRRYLPRSLAWTAALSELRLRVAHHGRDASI
jgi:hypothetical protein